MDCQSCEVIEQNEDLRELCEKQQQAIETVRAYALQVYSQAASVMSRHQPRGTWAFWKGSGETAREVYNLLNEGG